MAGINLTPNIAVMVGQGLVFGAAIVVVNKYIMKPYAKLRKLRDNLTSGSKSHSDQLLSEVDLKLNELKRMNAEIEKEVKLYRSQKLEQANSQAASILEKARQKNQQALENHHGRLKRDLQLEIDKAAETSNAIVDEFYEVLTN